MVTDVNINLLDFYASRKSADKRFLTKMSCNPIPAIPLTVVCRKGVHIAMRRSA